MPTKNNYLQITKLLQCIRYITQLPQRVCFITQLPQRVGFMNDSVLII